MKSTLATCLFVFVASIKGFSQTTVEEYNFLTKGYKIQLESGLDMKAGYELTKPITLSSPTRSCEFRILTRKKTDEVAGTLAIFHAANGSKYYFCIPVAGSDAELFNSYRQSLNIIDNAEAARDYSFFVSAMYDAMLKTAEDAEKKSGKKH